MPFFAKEHLPVSNKDILSWIYDEPIIDQDTPVCVLFNFNFVTNHE
jgi:hypothetical protein